MPVLKQNQLGEVEVTERKWKNIFTLGGIAAVIVILGTVLDIIIGTISGGDVSTVPRTAIDRFGQLQSNWLLGLYNLDLLNMLNAIIMIPVFFALYAALRREKSMLAIFALILYVFATSIFVTNNTALPMLELSGKYASAASDAKKALFAAAGEAMLARGEHGSLGVFLGFILTSVSDLIMAFAMLTGKVFNKTTAYMGISGSSLLIVYLILVTFIPGVKEMAVIIAAPGGLLSLAWIIMFTVRLFKLGSPRYT